MAPASHSISLTTITTTTTLLLCLPRIVNITAVAAVASPVAPILIPPSLNATATATTAANNLQCVDSADWATSAFQAYDCYSAIGLFEDYEVYRHSTTTFEFHASSITPAYAQFAQKTPRKYTYRSCTMAIAMLSELPRAVVVPGLPPRRRWPETDLGDYVRIEAAVLNVRDACLSIVGVGGGGGGGGGGGRVSVKGGGGGDVGGVKEGGEGGGVGFVNPTGYNVVGMHEAIGVFLWDTNSVMNQAVKEEVGVVWGENGSGNVNVTKGLG